jgi:hypothetical protein
MRSSSPLQDCITSKKAFHYNKLRNAISEQVYCLSRTTIIFISKVSSLPCKDIIFKLKPARFGIISNEEIFIIPHFSIKSYEKGYNYE